MDNIVIFLDKYFLAHPFYCILLVAITAVFFVLLFHGWPNTPNDDDDDEEEEEENEHHSIIEGTYEIQLKTKDKTTLIEITVNKKAN